MAERLKGFGDKSGNLSNRQRVAIGVGAGAVVLGGMAYGAKRSLDYVAGSDSSSFVRVGWRPTRQKAEDIDGWVDFDGDPNSGRLPRNYKSVGLLAMNGEQMDDLSEQYPGGVPAVAWQLGKRVVVGTLPNDQVFGIHADHPDLNVVGLRIGRGDLQAVAGLWVPEERQMAVPYSLEQYGDPVPADEMAARYPMVPFV